MKVRKDWEFEFFLQLRSNDFYFYNVIHNLAIDIWKGECIEYEDECIEDFQEALEHAKIDVIYIMLDRDPIDDPLSFEEYEYEMNKANKRLKKAIKKRTRI